MSGFNFRLQKVLDLRIWKEQERAGQLSVARKDMADATRALEHLSAVRTATWEQITVAHGVGGTVGHLQNLRAVIGQLDLQIEAAADQQDQAEAKLESTLSDFTDAFRERRILEKLRERQAETSRIDENQAERKEMDELASTRHTGPAPEAAETGS